MPQDRLRFRMILASAVAVALVGPAALSAQLVEFPTRVEEGAEFLRTVSTVGHTETPQGEGFEESHVTARFRVTALGEDGSGTIEVRVETVRIRNESPRAGLVEWDSTLDTAMPEDPGNAVLAAMAGRTFSMAFLPGGMVDAAPFSRQPESEEALLELWFLLSVVGPQDRADGLPSGFPPALRVNSPFTAAAPAGSGWGGHLSHTLVEVEEGEGRRHARIELSGGGGHAESGTSEITGQILFDLGSGGMVEATSVTTTRQEQGGNSVTRTMESRTQRIR